MLGVCHPEPFSSGSMLCKMGLVTSSFFTWLALRLFPGSRRSHPGAVVVLAAGLSHVEAKKSGLREDSVLRALASAIAVGLLAFLDLALDGEIDGGQKREQRQGEDRPTAREKAQDQPVKKLLGARPFFITMLPDDNGSDADASMIGVTMLAIANKRPPPVLKPRRLGRHNCETQRPPPRKTIPTSI